MEKSAKRITRRDMVKNAVLLGLAATVSPLTTYLKTRPGHKGGLIEEENSKLGTLEWQLQYTRFDDPVTMASSPLIRGLRSEMIEGYVSRTSVLPGENIDFMVSTNPAVTFVIDIYRL